jgi:succinate dehydrogenase / fumarate reductase cytochrome b subunit
MSNQRPVNLDLRTIRLPITAKASILHRASAVVLWVGLAFIIPSIIISLGNESGFNDIKSLVTDNFFGQFVCWGLLTAFGYYLAATLKHVIQDMGHFEELESGKKISAVAIGVGVFLSVIWGVWVWL